MLAERGFSQIKLLKTDLRTNPGQDSLNNCLAIKVLSPDITSFNPEESINHRVNSSTRMRRPNLKDKINDNTCNLKVHIIEDDHVPVQQPSLSEIVQSTTPAANITDTCSINSDREYEIHNLLDMMEDLRQDILNDKLYDSDTDHDGYD